MEIRGGALVRDLAGSRQSLSLNQDNSAGVRDNSHGPCNLQGNRVLEGLRRFQGVYTREDSDT